MLEALLDPWRDPIDVRALVEVVLLGATAGKALLGSKFKLGENRGVPIESELAPFVTATAHPSSILRAADDAAREQAYAAFVRDLSTVEGLLRRAS